MASMLSRRLYRLLITSPNPSARPPSSSLSSYFCTNTYTTISASDASSDSDNPDSPEPPPSDSEFDAAPSSSSSSSAPQRAAVERSLENGLDTGIYKAIVIGQVGQTPIQKRLRSGRNVTLLSVGTGGIRNNRRPFDNEDPKEYANRCAVQWHRVSIYPERLGDLAVKNVVPGSILYLEGNLETKIFNDPITGLVRRVREIAIRRNGRIVFLGQGSDPQQRSQGEFKGVGYY